MPDPAPGAHYPTGYPITLQVGGRSTLTVTTASLVGPDGLNLSGYELDSTNSDLKGNQWGVLPRNPLLPGSRYTIKVAGQVDGQPFSKTWSFTVAPLPS